MSAETRLADHRGMWVRKPGLRAVYEDYYRFIRSACHDGRTLEIGGGPGNLREYFLPQIISTDIQFAPWLDIVADAQALPFSDNSFDNLVMVDVLHHLESPKKFFSEAQRVVRPGGRIVLIEPAITPVSTLFFRLLHHEPVDMRANPLADVVLNSARNPYDSNQAIPTLLFGRYRQAFVTHFPALQIREKRWMSLLAYPLSGGFRRWSLLPAALAGSVLRLESIVAPLLGPLMAFRLAIVVDRL